MKLALGTVQFGLPYGVANQQGRVSGEAALRIVDAARRRGMDTLDTATAYGESEDVLGQASLEGWRVVSKIGSPPAGCPDIAEWVDGQVRSSLKRLGIESLHGLLLHRPQDLLQEHGDELYAALVHVRNLGLVEKIGISIYEPSELDAIVPKYPPTLVQAPFHILDRRMITSGWMSRLAAGGIDLHVRSVFLQGLLLMKDADRPQKFAPWNPLWAIWRDWLAEVGLTPLQACLRHALGFPEIARVLVGVDSLRQLEEICEAAAGGAPNVPADLCTEDIDLLDPSRWSRL
jgi:aryl-alcohol dehydrogenase-like predicted oxidoreductase